MPLVVNPLLAAAYLKAAQMTAGTWRRPSVRSRSDPPAATVRGRPACAASRLCATSRSRGKVVARQIEQGMSLLTLRCGREFEGQSGKRRDECALCLNSLARERPVRPVFARAGQVSEFAADHASHHPGRAAVTRIKRSTVTPSGLIPRYCGSARHTCRISSVVQEPVARNGGSAGCVSARGLTPIGGASI